MVGFERFSIYGFSIDYPEDSRVQFNPKAKREAGDVAFEFPDKVKIFLSWGELEKAAKSFQTAEEHAEHSLNNIRKSTKIKNFERISRDALNVHSHNGAYNRIKLEELTSGVFMGRRSVRRDACSVHVHCSDSSRYFIIYAMFSADTAEEYVRTLMAMVNSLKCH